MDNSQNEKQKKEYIKSATDEELLPKIRFDFKSVNAWGGYLETHIDTDYGSLEDKIDTSNLVNPGEEPKDSEELRKYALNRFREMC